MTSTKRSKSANGKLVVPPLYDFQDHRPFLKALLAANAETPFFSHRYLARKARLPVSYVADVVAGRRPLTLHAALAIAQFLQLDVMATEYFVMLAYRASHHDDVRRYCESVLATRYRGDPTPATTDPELEKTFSDVLRLAVFALADGRSAATAAAEIGAALTTFPGVSTATVEGVIAELRAAKLLEQGRGGVLRRRVESVHVLRDLPPGNDDVHRQYGENFVRYCQAVRGPAQMNSGFVRVDRREFDRVRGRLAEFRNWLRTLDRAGEADSAEHALLFQYDLNLFPVTR